MTSKVRIEHIGGNKPVDVLDKNGHTYGTLESQGRSIEVTVSGGVDFILRESGGERPVSMGGEPGSNVPDERVYDGGGA